MESSINGLENHLGRLEHHLDDGIVYKSDGGAVWTTGSSTGVMKSSIKGHENQVELLEHQLDL